MNYTTPCTKCYEGTRALSPKELEDATKLYHNNTHDLIYSDLNTEILKAFLSENKNNRKSAWQALLPTSAKPEKSEVDSFEDAFGNTDMM